MYDFVETTVSISSQQDQVLKFFRNQVISLSTTIEEKFLTPGPCAELLPISGGKQLGTLLSLFRLPLVLRASRMTTRLASLAWSSILCHHSGNQPSQRVMGTVPADIDCFHHVSRGALSQNPWSHRNGSFPNCHFTVYHGNQGSDVSYHPRFTRGNCLIGLGEMMWGGMDDGGP